jgi:hypothetical protein
MRRGVELSRHSTFPDALADTDTYARSDVDLDAAPNGNIHTYTNTDARDSGSQDTAAS